MSDTLPPLPEPAGFRTRYRSEPGMIGHYPWTYADQGRRRIDRPECEYENLFTADQMREYAAAALAAAQTVTPGQWEFMAAAQKQLDEGRQRREARDERLAAAVAEPVAYSVGRTLHWHPGRGVNDAQLYAAPPQREPQWVPVAERLPPSGQTVLACYTNRASRLRRIRAEWIAAKSVESNIEGSDIGVYDEATDTFYDPEGWYERIDNWGDYSSVGVCEGDVTHWMPLPDAPASAPKEQP